MQPTNYPRALCKVALTLLCTLNFVNGRAQTLKFTVSTDSFFEQQSLYYQTWLTQYGLGEVFKVYKVSTDTFHSRITLKLTTVYSAPDSALAAFHNLADSIAQNN